MSNSETNSFVALSEAMADAVAKAAISVVLVDARRRFPASGIAYSSNTVLTADHVIEREEDIRILLPDGSEMTATIAGRDPGNDLALLRLSGSGLVPAEAASYEARIGQLVLALGRPSSEGIQASLGVVSAIGGPVRTWRGGLIDRYIRTDTTPYPGFSGGPLIDAAGRVVGINTSGLGRGVALTIPAGLGWQIAEALARHGSVRRGYLGIRSQPVTLAAAQRQALGRQQETGLLVIWVEDDSPASRSDLFVGDILVGIANQPVTDPEELVSRLTGAIVNQPTPVELLRGGQVITLTVTIGERK